MLFTPVPDFTAVSGISIPDYSDQLLAEYPYYIVVYMELAVGSIKSAAFSVYQSKSPYMYLPEELSSYINYTDNCLLSLTDSLYVFSAYVLNGEWDGTWKEHSEIPAENNMVVLGNTEEETVPYELAVVYANHDIKVVTGVDSNGLPTKGDIWFANSAPTAPKPPFILPDGTELPALPEGCFEKYPYGMISYVEITDGEAAYALSVAEGTYIFAPGSATGEGSDYVISLLPGYRHYRYVVAPTAASGWEQYAESTTQHSGHDFSREDGTIEIRWCNHDILTATAMNDDGTPEIGPDLYRKSDVNYRVYGGWLNSMGNQARRLGGVSGELKPGEMESVFSGATLEPLTVTPTTEEQTFTPESPCIGFSSVTVEAAPDTGGGDSVETEELTSAEDVTFDFSIEDELCITNTAMSGTDTNKWQPGWYGIRFKASADFYVKCLRIYPKSGGIQDCELALWDYSTGTKLASVTVNETSVGLEWLEYGITPTQLLNGGLYVVAVHPNGSYVNLRTMLTTDCTLKNVGYLTPVSSSTDSCPTTVVDNLPALSMTIGTAPDQSRPTEYKIQYSYLEQLANEVERITGTTGITSIGQCIDLLKTVPATT